MSSKAYSLADLKAQSAKSQILVAVHGKVYDVTKFIAHHPGGEDALIDVSGTDATNSFEDVGHSEDARNVLKTLQVGTLKLKAGEVMVKGQEAKHQAGYGQADGFQYSPYLAVLVLLLVAALAFR